MNSAALGLTLMISCWFSLFIACFLHTSCFILKVFSSPNVLRVLLPLRPRLVMCFTCAWLVCSSFVGFFLPPSCLLVIWASPLTFFQICILTFVSSPGLIGHGFFLIQILQGHFLNTRFLSKFRLASTKLSCLSLFWIILNIHIYMCQKWVLAILFSNTWSD